MPCDPVRPKVGCLKGAMCSAANVTHGKSASLTYGVWRNIKQRCSNPNHDHYRQYGARGIKLCERWQVFENFLADMGEAEVGMTVERINNDGNYEPSNCRWATRKEQARNRRSSRLLTFSGRTQSLAAWADELGIRAGAIVLRLRRGWTELQALSRPCPYRRVAEVPVENLTPKG